MLMLMLVTLTLVALTLVAGARAAAGPVADGVCDPGVQSVEHVEIEKVPGLWRAYQSVGDNSTSRCPAVRIQLEGGELVFNRIFIEDGTSHDLRDSVYYKDRKVFYPELLFTKKDSDWHLFNVLDTDSVTSSLLYLCKQITPGTKKIVAWKFSKDLAVPASVRARNEAAARRHPELASAAWREHDWNGCPTSP